MFGRLGALGALLVTLAACGGHGGGGSSATSTATPAPPALTNLATLVVDGGPSVLATGANPFIADNIAYVSVTLCAPGTTTCQTIDHVQVDTGSVGLRIVQSVLDPALLAAMPNQVNTATSNPVGECYQYVGGYAFGSVRDADFQIGGEKVAGMPLQVIGDTGLFADVPGSCSSGGGGNLNTVQSFAANGIIGLGVTTTDCGAVCSSGGEGAAIYYDCQPTGCGQVIAQAANASAPFQQLPNPVAALPVDNNGIIISLPSAPNSGEASLTGTIYFGIGTQANNALGSASVLQTTPSTSDSGAGLVTATYNGQGLPDSFIDSGSNLYLFVDDNLPLCTGADFTGYYCPASSQQINPTIYGMNGGNISASFTLNNAQTLLSTMGVSVLPGVGANPTAEGLLNAYPSSFDFGLPFFYGRKIYTAIEGRTAGGVVGPYFAY